MIISAVLFLSACSVSSENRQQENVPKDNVVQKDTGFVLTGPESYDSADTAILVEKNSKDGKVTFLNLELGRRYTLSYDGTTRLYNKYKESISMEQLRKGAIVDITFLKEKKHLTTLQLNAEAWSLTGIEHFELDKIRGELHIGEETYQLNSNTQYLFDGRDIEWMDINEKDIISVQGMGSTALCVQVEKGHGYLRLVNDDKFIGGWIEVGQSQIQQITEDMLLVVTEGSYLVNVSHGGGGGSKQVIINRNEETSMDIGDFVIPEPEMGQVLFNLAPSKAELYVDGAKVDATYPVELTYGIHQFIGKADGYKSLTQYVRVNQKTVAVDVILESIQKEEDKSDKDSTDKDAEEDTKKEETTPEYYKVNIDTPEKAEIYLDGNYIGISPISFRKVAGTHVVTLRRNGYVTRSYTIQVDSESKDVTYSFVELVAESGGLTAD